MYIPLIKRLICLNEVFVERALPCKGTIRVSVGDRVEAFTELGAAKVSYKAVSLASQIKFVEGKGVGSHFYAGEKVGTVGLKTVRAPFSCVVVKKEGHFELDEEKRDYQLLAGVWGEVADVVEERSVLLKTQVMDLHLLACVDDSIEGELIVFPNPSEALQKQYIEKFSKSVFSKIIYAGDMVDVALLEKGLELGVGGIIAGSAGKESFDFAKKHGLFLGTFSGFGRGPTPIPVFDLLNDISNRFVFIYGEKNLIRVPMPEPFAPEKVEKTGIPRILKKVTPGLHILIVNETHFGQPGVVEKISDSRILVKLDTTGESLEVLVPNVLAVE